MKENYNPFLKTALHRKTLSAPMRLLKEKNLLQGTILDMGCGAGNDVQFLQKDGFDIVGYDKYNPVYKEDRLLECYFDTITCNYVFNVIPDLQEHYNLIKLLKQLGKNIYIAVRSDIKAKNDTWVWSDREQGYWTSKGSFQRFYNNTLVSFLFGVHGEIQYIHDGSDFKLFKLT
jgi:SAM-dependent methyltransferase